MSQQVNLYQPLFRKEEKKFSTVAMLQGAGLVLVGVVAMYAYTQWQVGALRGELKQAEQKHVSVTKRLAEATEKSGARQPSQSLDGEIARLEQEIAAKEGIQQILQRGIFSNTRGFSEYFVAFARQHIAGVWLTGLDITGAAEQMTLAGRSTHPELVPRYMQKLSTEKTLAGIEFRVFQMNRPAPDDVKDSPARYVEFQAKTMANPG